MDRRDALRLLREDWSDPTELARELYTMLAGPPRTPDRPAGRTPPTAPPRPAAARASIAVSTAGPPGPRRRTLAVAPTEDLPESRRASSGEPPPAGPASFDDPRTTRPLEGAVGRMSLTGPLTSSNVSAGVSPASRPTFVQDRTASVLPFADLSPGSEIAAGFTPRATPRVTPASMITPLAASDPTTISMSTPGDQSLHRGLPPAFEETSLASRVLVTGAPDQLRLRQPDLAVRHPLAIDDSETRIGDPGGVYANVDLAGEFTPFPREPLQQAKVAKTRSGGIPAMVSDVPGSAQCDLYDFDGTSLEQGQDVKVFNTAGVVAGSKYIQVKRIDSYWFVDVEGC